jgi:hypothetical protein
MIYSFVLPFDQLSIKKLYLPSNLNNSNVESIMFSNCGNIFAVIFKSDILIYEDCNLLYKESFNDIITDFKWIVQDYVYSVTGKSPYSSVTDDFACGPRMGPGLKGCNGFVFTLRSGQVRVNRLNNSFQSDIHLVKIIGYL